MALILIRYGEIALKGKNRNDFERALRHNIRRALKTNGVAGSVREEDRRLFVETDDPDAAIPHLQRVFGIVSVSPVVEVDRSIESMREEALAMAQRFGLSPAQSFATVARRADKSYPHTSPEIGRLVGGAVQEATGARVDLSGAADFTIGIELRRENAFMYGDIYRAPGGLPLPMSGRAVALISGGIDSPVAAWMMMKRGCGVIPLHFENAPAEKAKVLDNIRVLEGYSYGWRLEPLFLSHAATVEPVLERLERLHAGRWACVFCKRAMLQRAAQVAEEAGAQAVVMGDSLGQVASQTLHNMEVISYGMPKPILRPLLGMDKSEIMDLARKIGTFDVSTRVSSACSFLPCNPLTKGSVQELRELLKELESEQP